MDGSNQQLPLVPLGPGDLIDRAVRFYRQSFATFLLIAAPPVVAATLALSGWTLAARALISQTGLAGSDQTLVYYILIWIGSILIFFVEAIATLSVMGGASRNFVRHLLFGEPISFRATYRNAGSRWFTLIAAASTIVVIVGIAGTIIFYFALFLAAIIFALVFTALGLESVPFLAVIAGILIFLSFGVAAVWLFFLIASRVAYVPQVILVEGLNFGAAISRSANLAHGNVVRLAALGLFTLIAAYAALAIFYIPLGWYAWLQDVPLFSLNRDIFPVWYEVASQLIWQASLILMTPVLMLGLCLLYVDERVRHEGYDIEIMAASRLGDIPPAATSHVNPLQPALGHAVTPLPADRSTRRKPYITLGLK